MYLISTINAENGWEILSIGSKKNLQIELEEHRKSVNYNSDGSQKNISCMYSDTLSKNARILTNKETVKFFGGRIALERELDSYYGL